MKQFDRNKSLQELDGHDWGEPNYGSHLVTECHRLHRVPLRGFTIEDLRIMIGQNFDLEYLIPLALEHLRTNPLAEGAYYEGDLLVNVLRADPQFWQQNPEWREEVKKIAHGAIGSFSSSPAGITWVVMDAVANAFEQFERSAKANGKDPC